MRRAGLIFMLSAAVLPMQTTWADGEAVNGFPNWSERVLLEWINRARADPQTDLAGCPSGNCPDVACYTPQPPRVWNSNLAHSGRYHSDEMLLNDYFDHYSECTVVNNIAALYLSEPQSCDGSASCGCAEHMITGVEETGTNPFSRMQLFGGDNGSAGEIIAEDGAGPDSTFYLWLWEPTTSSACAFSEANGHRYLILTSTYGAVSAGPGVAGSLSTVDFDNSAGTAKIPSGAHYPQQATSVDAWVNWSDTASPSVYKINVDGVCSDMTLARGSPANGAWHLTVNSVGSGCHRYFFAFKDSAGIEVLYPTTGSLAIGDDSMQCPDWDINRPAGCPSFDEIFANDFEW